jgi:hypothetical protein
MQDRIPRERINALFANTEINLALSALNLAGICDDPNMAEQCHNMACTVHHTVAIFLDETSIAAADRKNLTGQLNELEQRLISFRLPQQA